MQTERKTDSAGYDRTGRYVPQNLTQWQRPDSYMAWDEIANPVGDYLIAGQHRDSDALARSNYRRIFEDLLKCAAEHECDGEHDGRDYTVTCGECERQWCERCDPAPSALCHYCHGHGYSLAPIGSVYDFRAGHWAVGWVEEIVIRADAPEAVLRMADEIAAALADYPVYDESDFSELECTEAAEYWESMSVRDRLEAIERSGASVSRFCARRDELPRDDCGRLLEYLNSP